MSLVESFESSRPHLRAVAQRILGSSSDADDAVQEAWLRLSRADVSQVENLRAWLTTVVARVCLDQLRSRRSRPEEPLDEVAVESSIDPEEEALLGESVGLALVVVLESLTPAERVAFVLHDMFELPYDDIAPIVGRTPEAARQLASRARRRVRGASAGTRSDLERRRAVVDAFLTASRAGDLRALIALLDPDIVARADAATVALGSPAEVRGAGAVAAIFSGRARGARAALIDGQPGMVWAPGGRLRVVWIFTIHEDRVTAIESSADPARLERLQIAY